jgi:FkbM family methyltransferase
MSKRILFDVGANNGSQWFNELQQDQENTLVYMFEPTPRMCAIIKESYNNLKNWVLIEKAVSNFEGKATFNIAGRADWGCSSLLKFNEDRFNTWPGNRTSYEHGDLHFTDSVEVDVITLNSYLKENPHITQIDHLHIDTQGSDLNVLKGCTDYLNIIKVGNIEAALEAPLYVGSPGKDECVEWLRSNNFNIDAVTGGPHECDIHFSR